MDLNLNSMEDVDQHGTTYVYGFKNRSLSLMRKKERTVKNIMDSRLIRELCIINFY